MQDNQKKDWSFFVYIAGENNLSEFGVKDISELERIGSKDHTNIVVEFDSAGEYNGTVRFQIPQINPVTGIANRAILKMFKDRDSGNPRTLYNFLQYGKDYFPAKNYCLVVWNHGSGFRDSGGSGKSRIVFRKSPTYMKVAKRQNARGIARDDLTGNALDMIELANVLKNAGFTNEKKLGVLAFDACLMNMLEVAYQMSPHARFLVGSEDLEPGYGADYKANARSLNRKNTSPKQLAVDFVNNYHQYYKYKRDLWPITQSAIDLTRIDTLARRIDEFAGALLALLPDNTMKISDVAEEVQAYAPLDDFDDYVDLGDLANLCKEYLNDETVTRTANALLQTLKTVIVANKFEGSDVRYSHGVTIWFPETQHKFRHHRDPYQELSFTKKYPNWMKFLSKYHRESEFQKRAKARKLRDYHF
ncbi:MAG: clostripain-related cysteine peptidase [Thermoproteota archaeon]